VAHLRRRLGARVGHFLLRRDQGLERHLGDHLCSHALELRSGALDFHHRAGHSTRQYAGRLRQGLAALSSNDLQDFQG